jgi:hypothetical protein
MKKIFVIAFVLFGIATFGTCQIPTPQINLTGNIGCQGFPCLNNGTLAMTDASRTMTAQETSAVGGFKVTGTWTANRTLTIPNGRFQFVSVENATSGGFSLILCSAGGGTCLTIPNGVSATSVWYDGTNVTGTVGGGGITALTGPVTASGSGSVATTITPTGVTAGNYNLGGQVVDVNSAGQITSIGNPFSVGMSCTAAGTYELGFASTNPNVCTLTYSNGTAASASIGDGTNTVNLTTPYTSGNLAYSYTANTTFSANATATNSQTASASNSFGVEYCTFVGVGGYGGTGATATGSSAGNQCASETATVTGASVATVLVSQGLGNTYAGQTFTLTPSNQYLVLLLSGGCGHSIKVNGFTAAFNTQAITYTNILGGSQTGMCIYTGTGSLTGTYQVEVAAL